MTDTTSLESGQYYHIYNRGNNRQSIFLERRNYRYYIHHSPQKHGVVADFRAWPYSSYRAHLSEKPTRLEKNDVLAWFGGLKGFEMSHREEPDKRVLDPLVLEEID